MRPDSFVHHQHNPVLVRVAALRPVQSLRPAATLPAAQTAEQVDVALVFEVAFPYLLFAGLGHQHLIVPELTLVDLIAMAQTNSALPWGGMHQHSFKGLSSFFSASCAPSLGGCSPLTPPAGPPIISGPTGRFPAGQRNQVGFRSAIQFLWPALLLLLTPQGRFDPFLYATAAYPFHCGAGDLEGPGNLFVRQASVFPRFIAQQQDACMGLLVRCCPSLGNQGLQFLLLFRGSSIRYFLAGTTPLLEYNSPMPSEYTSCASIQ